MQFRDMKHLVVTGGSSGLGRAIIEEAIEGDRWETITNVSLSEYGEPLFVKDAICDLRRPAEVRTALEGTACDVLINCAGVNHIDWLENLDTDDWDRLMDVNARSIFLTTSVLLDSLVDGGTVLNIVSNASHMPMTASLVYNASKAAAHMMTLQLARELTVSQGITVFGISPAKMAGTEMSQYIAKRVPEVRGWTKEHADEYQRQGLLTREEIHPATLAEFVHWLIEEKRRHFHLSGCVIPYGA